MIPVFKTNDQSLVLPNAGQGCIITQTGIMRDLQYLHSSATGAHPRDRKHLITVSASISSFLQPEPLLTFLLYEIQTLIPD